MTSPAVQTTATSAVTTAGTSHAVTLPASIAAGDLLIVIFGYAVTSQTIDWTNGANPDWAAIPNFKTESAAGNTFGIDAGYVVAAGGETSMTVVSSVNTKSAHCAFRISGHIDPATTAPEVTTGATGTDNAANPPSITPAGGSKDYLAIACAGQSNEQSFTVFPTGYTNTIQADTGVGGATTTNGDTGACSLEFTGSSQDPGTFDYNGVSSDWAAQTIIIYPAAGATPITMSVGHVLIGF